MTTHRADVPATRAWSAEQIRAAIHGKNPRVSRRTALYLLARRPEIADRASDFQAVLENTDEPQSLRYHAALHLGAVDSAEARAILAKNLALEDELLLGRVMRSLAVVGKADALPLLGELRRRLQGEAAQEAEWAERLLAHRVGAPGHEVRLPDDRSFLENPSGEWRALEVGPATDVETDVLRASLEHQPLGIDVAWDGIYRLQCGPRVMLLTLNRSVVADLRAHIAKRACSVPAVIVDWHPREQHSAPVYVLLLGAAKSKDGMVLTAWTPKGRLSFAGPAHAEGETFRFSLRGVADFGVLPVDIAGEWTNQKLRLTRLNVGTSVPKRLEAEPDARSGS